MALFPPKEKHAVVRRVHRVRFCRVHPEKRVRLPPPNLCHFGRKCLKPRRRCILPAQLIKKCWAHRKSAMSAFFWSSAWCALCVSAEEKKNGLGPALSPVLGSHFYKSIPPEDYPIHGSCIVSDRMQLIFLKTAKSAGSTVLLGWIRPSLCPPKNASDYFVGWGTSKNSNVFSKSCDTNIVFPPPGTDASDCNLVPRWKFEQYFVITTIRNPYGRLRSSFTYCRPNLTWDQFCEDPKNSGNVCRGKTGIPNLTGHAYNPHYRFPIHWSYHSWWGWHIDYAIRTESMAEGISEVAAIVNARAAARGETLRLMSQAVDVNVQHTTEKTQTSICNWYMGTHAHCAAAIERTLDPWVLGYADYCNSPVT
jgi:hypothetical protein